jgi:hypothetical protein
VQNRFLDRDARLRCDLIGANCDCATPVWFLLSHRAAAQLLASSCSPLRFAWTTGRRSARGISVCLATCSRSPALADLTTEVKMIEKKILRPGNEFTLSYFEIWPFGRLHTSRFS